MVDNKDFFQRIGSLTNPFVPRPVMNILLILVLIGLTMFAPYWSQTTQVASLQSPIYDGKYERTSLSSDCPTDGNYVLEKYNRGNTFLRVENNKVYSPFNAGIYNPDDIIDSSGDVKIVHMTGATNEKYHFSLSNGKASVKGILIYYFADKICHYTITGNRT